jgi:hypothetical protein
MFQFSCHSVVGIGGGKHVKGALFAGTHLWNLRNTNNTTSTENMAHIDRNTFDHKAQEIASYSDDYNL